MLHYKTIDTKTLELLKEIEKIDIFKNLRLVGGTALALQLGHRVSVDLDFFGLLKADKISILNALHSIGKVKTIQNTENIHIYTVNNLKIDLVNYPYPWLSAMLYQDNLRLADLPDIAAMKLAAITGRGSKKDFIDIYFLLKHYTLNQLLTFYNKKYDDGSIFLVLKSLVYFEDADADVMPNLFKKLAWETVKTSISKKLINFINKKNNPNFNANSD